MDVKIIIGDMNAKVGKEEEYKPVIGKYSLHDYSNDNGIRLINFAVARNMLIGGTLFKHKDIHKITWNSPDGNTHNQIDHLLIDRRHGSNLLDIRSYRGANIDSDHHLVVSRIRARISNARKTQNTYIKRFNCNKLKNPEIKTTYVDEINSHLIKHKENQGINEKW